MPDLTHSFATFRPETAPLFNDDACLHVRPERGLPLRRRARCPRPEDPDREQLFHRRARRARLGAGRCRHAGPGGGVSQDGRGTFRPRCSAAGDRAHARALRPRRQPAGAAESLGCAGVRAPLGVAVPYRPGVVSAARPDRRRRRDDLELIPLSQAPDRPRPPCARVARGWHGAGAARAGAGFTRRATRTATCRSSATTTAC